MTQREKEIVENAIFHLMNESTADFTLGIHLLHTLIGKSYDTYIKRIGLRCVHYLSIANGKQQDFAVRGINNPSIEYCQCESPERDIGDDYCMVCHKQVSQARMDEILKKIV